MIHAERKRLKAVQQAEARGENVWTTKFEERVRVKIVYALQHAAGHPRTMMAACDGAQVRLGGDLGQYRLTDDPEVYRSQDFLKYLHACPDDMMPSVIEAAIHGLRGASDEVLYTIETQGFEDDVRKVLQRHYILWDLVDGEMIERKSQELYSAVVEPAVRLLAGRPDLAAVEHAYQEALREVSRGTPEDAITDAGTALQEMLRACHCKGNQIGDLAADARKKGLLAPHDSRLAAGIQDIMEWVAADRSQKGDSHVVVYPSKEDAWLIIHIVGALIVRLAAGKR